MNSGLIVSWPVDSGSISSSPPETVFLIFKTAFKAHNGTVVTRALETKMGNLVVFFNTKARFLKWRLGRNNPL